MKWLKGNCLWKGSDITQNSLWYPGRSVCCGAAGAMSISDMQEVFLGLLQYRLLWPGVWAGWTRLMRCSTDMDQSKGDPENVVVKIIRYNGLLYPKSTRISVQKSEI